MDLTFTGICLIVAMLAGFGLLLLHLRRRTRRDPQRLFTWEQKKVLIYRAGGRCEHKSPLWRRCPASGAEADHVIPWSRGGPTQIWNGQLLCHRHNVRKSNLIPSPFYRWRLTRRRRRYPRQTWPAVWATYHRDRQRSAAHRMHPR